LALAPIEIPEAERKMIAWWKFDEAEGGEASDSSGNDLVGTLIRYVDGGTVLQPGVWYHVTGVYSQGNNIRTYVNGNLDRELSTVGVLAPTTGTIKIGREPFMDAYFFNGLIDELSIYNYALSDADIAAVYSGKALPITQAETPDTGEKQAGRSGNFIPVLVIVIIAVVAVGLATHRKKATT